MPTDTLPAAESVRLAAIRRMTPGARLASAVEFSSIGRRLLEDGIRARHPEYDETRVRRASIRVWLTPPLYRAAYPDQEEVAP